MRLIILVLLSLLLSFNNLGVVSAKPSVLVDKAAGCIYVSGMQSISTQESMNKLLAGIKLVSGGKPEVLSNNVSVLSMIVPTPSGKKGITFSVNSGKEMKITDVISFNPTFIKRVGNVQDISSYALDEGALLVEKNSDGQFVRIPFAEIITAVDINKLAGCFNIFNLNEQASGKELNVKQNDLLAVVLAADKMRGEGWESVHKNNSGGLLELGRSYVMRPSNPHVDEYGYEIVVFAVQNKGAHSLQLKFKTPDKKVQKEFNLSVLAD